MASLKIKQIESALQKKGFQRDTRGRDHIFFRFYYNGKLSSVQTHYSHGETEIRDPLISKMAKQINLNKDQFFTFVECHINENMYIEILKEKGVLE